MTQKVTAARAVLDVLRAAGVDHVYSVPGESFLALIDAVYDETSVRFVSTRHEEGAGFMAAAHARLTGRPAAAMMTRAVGGGHGSIAIHSASIHRSYRPAGCMVAFVCTSVRFLISVTLLVSALNGIVLLSATLAMLSGATNDEAEPSHAAVSKLSGCYETLLEGIEADPCLADLEAQVTGPEALLAVQNLRAQASLWVAEGRSPATLQPVSQARYQVAGALYVAHQDPGVSPALWFLLVWVCFATGLTLFVAFRLRTLLTNPLYAVANAAARVASGDLSSPIPTLETGTELASLAGSVEAMRRNLVRSIGRVEDERRTVRNMLDALKDGVLLIDQKRRLVGYNPAASRLIATMNQQSLSEGAPLKAVLPQLDEELLLNSSGGKQEVDLDGAGTVRYVTLHSLPLARLGPTGEPGHVIIVRDVTRSVEVEDLKREFLSVVTHELKTPLTAVRGYVKLLLMGKGGELTPKQTQLLSVTHEQAEVLATMVQDLLDATRLEGGQLSLDLAEVTVSIAVDEAVSAFAGEAQNLGIELVRGPADGSVHADPFRLQQILGNLVRNALKFTQAGGRVTLSAKTVGDAVAITVSDTGRGISPAAQEQLFRKFYQVERGDKRRSGGAGLGLYICSQLAQQMGGDIQCRSQVGVGSHFTVTLMGTSP